MKNLILILLMFTASIARAGVPFKYFNCPKESISIQQPSNSQGYFMDKDCHTVYVKPPIEGKMKFGSYTSAATDTDCQSSMAIINMVNEQRKRNQKAFKNLQKATRNLERKYQTIAGLKRKCDPANKKLVYVKGLQLQIDNKSQDLEDDIKQGKENLKVCADPAQGLICREVERDIKEFTEELADLSIRQREIERGLRSAESLVRSCELYVNTEVTRIQANDKDYQEAVLKIQTDTQELKRLLSKEAKPLMSEVGGQIAVSFLSGHNALVNEFKNLNSTLGLDFRPMPIQNGIIYFDKVNNENQDQFPVQLRTNISGLISADPDDGIAASILASGQGSVAFGEGAGGTITINKYTACTLADNSSASSKDEKLKDIINTLKPTVTFSYEVQAVRKVAIKYSESNLYQLIKNSTSRSGLFRSSSSTSITEKSSADKWIEILISAEDERLKFENAEKLMMDLRQEYLDAALMKVAKSYLSDQQLQAKDPGPDGATKSAKELRENCPHAYCQAAAVVLNIGSALFGKSTSQADMTRVVSAQEKVDLISELPMREYGQQTLSVVRE